MIDLSLGRIERLLDKLGHPERRLPPVVHVAGTNGKGSVVAFLRAIVEAAGLKAHVYTSPHLVRFAERIRVAGRLIADDVLTDVLEECEAANKSEDITFFEITTAAAFLAFARMPADVALLEVGLGGRLDATNVVPPAVTVIAPVSLDHQQYLGSTLARIAVEKAGILKPGVPAVIGPQHPIARRVLLAEAGACAAPVMRWGVHFHARRRATDGALLYRDAGARLILPAPSLPGPHQYANAATAVAAACLLQHAAVTASAIARGIASAEWPARMQRLTQGRLVAPVVAKGFEVWLDGGHNPSAGRALAHAVSDWRDQPLYLVAGMVESKDPRGFFAPLAAHVDGLWTVPVPGEHAGWKPEKLCQLAAKAHIHARPAASVADALDAIAERPAGRILITGSLYLAGAVLTANGRRSYPR